MHLRGALDELHVEHAAGHGVHTADPTAGLEERPRLPVPPGASAPSAPATSPGDSRPRHAQQTAGHASPPPGFAVGMLASVLADLH